MIVVTVLAQILQISGLNAAYSAYYTEDTQGAVAAAILLEMLLD